MKNSTAKILALVITLLCARNVYAQRGASDLMGLGMSPQLASYLTTNGVPMSNNQYEKILNAAGTGYINVLKVDSTDDTVLNSDTGDVIKLSVAGTTEATLDDDKLTLSGASFEFIPGATSLLFRNNADSASNLSITDAGLATVRAGLTVTASDITATAGNFVVSDSTKGITFTPGTVAAAGSTQGDATAIAHRVEVVTAADATKGVILPATPTAGDYYIIANGANAVLKIYPGSGDAINGTAANSAVSVAAYAYTPCFASSASQWWCGEAANP